MILKHLDARGMTNMLTNEFFKGRMPAVPMDERDTKKWIDILWASLRLARELVLTQDVVMWSSHVNHTVEVILNTAMKNINEKRSMAMSSGE